MPPDIFTQLALVIAVACIVSIIMRLLKQPLIMGYILSGIIVGPSFLHLIHSKDAFATFSEIGIALLLFIIGLELSVATIKRLGKPVFVTAIAILLVIGGLGFLITDAFRLTTMESIIVGLSLFFSSTIIIAKVLSDKKELSRLNGQIAIGIVLVDDIVATFALLFISAGSGDGLNPGAIMFLIVKGAIAVGVLILLSTKVLPSVTKFAAKSQELLFIFALAWGFGIAALFNMVGFSVEVGALFAGVALAHLPYAHQIGTKLKTLRDFFIILFFISLGESLHLASLVPAILPAIILSAVVILIKPIIVMACLGSMGYTKRTSFKTGVNLSQISEFSIILVVLALNAGLVSEYVSALVTLVAIVTIALSTYMMQYDDWLFKKLEPSLRLFEKRTTTEDKYRAKSYPLVLFGYLNGGSKFIKNFRSSNKKFVVVDYDPDVIEDLEHKNIEVLYGDAADPELLAEIDFDKATLVINTIADHSVNKELLTYIRSRNKETIIVCYSNDRNLAPELYELGASYVMLPHSISSEQLSTFIQTHGLSKSSFSKYKEQHLKDLEGLL